MIREKKIVFLSFAGLKWICSILCSAGNCWKDDGSEVFFGTIIGGDKWYEDGEIWKSKVGEWIMSCFQGKLSVSDC